MTDRVRRRERIIGKVFATVACASAGASALSLFAPVPAPLRVLGAMAFGTSAAIAGGACVFHEYACDARTRIRNAYSPVKK